MQTYVPKGNVFIQKALKRKYLGIYTHLLNRYLDSSYYPPGNNLKYKVAYSTNVLIEKKKTANPDSLCG